MKRVQIRFNTNYKPGDGSKEWRVLIDGEENFCNHVTINCPCHTSRDFIEGTGWKWHISCVSENIFFTKDPESGKENFFREIEIR